MDDVSKQMHVDSLNVQVFNHQSLKDSLPVIEQAGSSGKGFPYAPEDFPSPGDVWTWRVGKRHTPAGFWQDRSVHPPDRLQSSMGNKISFRGRASLEQYIRKAFPDADVDAFFASFVWKIPCTNVAKDASLKAIKSKGCSKSAVIVQPGDCKASNEMCLNKARTCSALTPATCNICCSEPKFCRNCCCILCSKTIDWIYDGYSFIKCEAPVDEKFICGHVAHIECALRAYLAGKVGGSIDLDAQYYCRCCDNKTDLLLHLEKIIKVSESIDNRDDMVKVLNLGFCMLRGSEKGRAEKLRNHIATSIEKLKHGVLSEDIWRKRREISELEQVEGSSSNASNVVQDQQPKSRAASRVQSILSSGTSSKRKASLFLSNKPPAKKLKASETPLLSTIVQDVDLVTIPDDNPIHGNVPSSEGPSYISQPLPPSPRPDLPHITVSNSPYSVNEMQQALLTSPPLPESNVAGPSSVSSGDEFSSLIQDIVNSLSVSSFVPPTDHKLSLERLLTAARDYFSLFKASSFETFKLKEEIEVLKMQNSQLIVSKTYLEAGLDSANADLNKEKEARRCAEDESVALQLSMQDYREKNAHLVTQNQALAKNCEFLKRKLKRKEDSLNTVLDALKEAKSKVDSFLEESVYAIIIQSYESALMSLYVGNRSVWPNLDLSQLDAQTVELFSEKIRKMEEGIEVPDDEPVDAKGLLSFDIPSIDEGSESVEEEEEEKEGDEDLSFGLGHDGDDDNDDDGDNGGGSDRGHGDDNAQGNGHGDDNA